VVSGQCREFCFPGLLALGAHIRRVIGFVFALLPVSVFVFGFFATITLFVVLFRQFDRELLERLEGIECDSAGSGGFADHEIGGFTPSCALQVIDLSFAQLFSPEY
jgi:hypothetical protein